MEFNSTQNQQGFIYRYGLSTKPSESKLCGWSQYENVFTYGERNFSRFFDGELRFGKFEKNKDILEGVMYKLYTGGGFDPQLGGFFGPSKNPQPPNFEMSTPDFFNLK